MSFRFQLDIRVLLAATLTLLVPYVSLAADGRLLFKSGFEDGVSIENLSRITGIDSSTGYSWDNLDNKVFSGHKYYYSVNKKPTTDYIDSKIITTTGPYGKPTRVLQNTVKREDPSTGSKTRNEYMLLFQQKNGGFKEGYLRYHMRLPKAPVDFMIMEWKEPNSGSGTGGSNNYRSHLRIIKDGKRTIFSAKTQQVQPNRVTEWSTSNKNITVPHGRWFLVEAYFKKGDQDGRIFFAIDGNIVFDAKVRTQHKSNPLPLQFWSPFKIYPDGGQLEPYVKEHGPIVVQYDNFEYWTSFPGIKPEAPHNLHILSTLN